MARMISFFTVLFSFPALLFQVTLVLGYTQPDRCRESRLIFSGSGTRAPSFSRIERQAARLEPALGELKSGLLSRYRHAVVPPKPALGFAALSKDCRLADFSNRMESSPALAMEIWRRTLSQIPTRFGRMTFLASLRDPRLTKFFPSVNRLTSVGHSLN